MGHLELLLPRQMFQLNPRLRLLAPQATRNYDDDGDGDDGTSKKLLDVSSGSIDSDSSR